MYVPASVFVMMLCTPPFLSIHGRVVYLGADTVSADTSTQATYASPFVSGCQFSNRSQCDRQESVGHRLCGETAPRQSTSYKLRPIELRFPHSRQRTTHQSVFECANLGCNCMYSPGRRSSYETTTARFSLVHSLLIATSAITHLRARSSTSVSDPAQNPLASRPKCLEY